MINSLKMEFQAGHSKNESGILTLTYNLQDIDTTGLIIHFIKYMLSNLLKTPYSAGVHSIAIGKHVRKIGLPYNNSLYPN